MRYVQFCSWNGWVLAKSTIHLSNLLKSTESVTLHNNGGNMEATAMMSGIYISEKAKARVESLLAEEGKGDDYFVRVSVVSGGCSGLTYKMDFDNEIKAGDQVFEDKGMKLVTDRKSILYLFNTTLEFSDGLDGKGFHFMNPNASRTCACGESFSV
jgi:iron-sulfur cluster assembly protein